MNIIVKDNFKLYSNYIAGFTAAYSSFFISRPTFSNKWPNYNATFSIAQYKRDVRLLNRMIKVLNCKYIKSDSNNMKYLIIRNKKELYNIIIPFFTKYNINDEKHKDFMNFATTLTILYNNLRKGFNNLSADSINKLKYFISFMNKIR